MAIKNKGLGRGLDALLGSSADEFTDEVKHVPLSHIQAGVYQPRNSMDEGALHELADSIKSQGLMQPILLRPIEKKGAVRYEIIAGERRYRAAKIAGLAEVPALIRQVADENAALMALIENMQREDLNSLEEAAGIKRLIDEFNYTHEQAAQALGRSRSATTNLLRLLNLAEPVQTMLLAGDIDMGHARALLALEPAAQIMLATELVAKRWSVRETEKQVAAYLAGNFNQPLTNAAVQQKTLSADIKRFEKTLSDYLGTTVQIKSKANNRGSLEIRFQSWDHLNDLLKKQNLLALFDES